MWWRMHCPENMKKKDPFSLSFIVPDWLQAVRQEWLQDPKSSHLIQQLQTNALAPLGYSWLQDEI
jgi:hypothetical protein